MRPAPVSAQQEGPDTLGAVTDKLGIKEVYLCRA